MLTDFYIDFKLKQPTPFFHHQCRDIDCRTAAILLTREKNQ